MKKPNLHLKVSLIILLMPLIIPFNESTLFSQTSDCAAKLVRAEEEYHVGNFSTAVDLIKPCLTSNELNEDEKGKAYRLLGLVYIAQELEKNANEAVKNLLIMVPNYKPDPAKDPPQLKKMVEEIASNLNPVITGITPDKANGGDKGLTLTVTGSDFVYGSSVRFNGVDKKTEFIDSTELQADITSNDLKDDGEYEVVVYSPISNGKLSNVKIFTVKSTSSFPWTWVAVGAGAVAAGVVAIITLGGKSDTETPATMADPPGRPPQ